MTTFSDFMEDRAKKIDRGTIRHNRQATEFFNKKNRTTCVTVAQDQAKADRSDPFVFNRSMSHMMNGLARRNDYEHQWGKERGFSPFKPHNPMSVDIATHRKIPCI